MSTALIVGGDQIASIKEELKNFGITEINHWSGRKVGDGKKVIPHDTKLIVLPDIYKPMNAIKNDSGIESAATTLSFQPMVRNSVIMTRITVITPVSVRSVRFLLTTKTLSMIGEKSFIMKI